VIREAAFQVVSFVWAHRHRYSIGMGELNQAWIFRFVALTLVVALVVACDVGFNWMPETCNDNECCGQDCCTEEAGWCPERWQNQGQPAASACSNVHCSALEHCVSGACMPNATHDDASHSRSSPSCVDGGGLLDANVVDGGDASSQDSACTTGLNDSGSRSDGG